MRARPFAFALAALASLVLAVPAVAPAADGDVQTAWTSEDRALAAETVALNSAMRQAERARFRRRVAPVVAALQRMEGLTVAVRDRVLQQSPSTASGGAARDTVLRSLAGFAQSLRTLRQAVQAAGRRRLAVARRLLGRAERLSAGADGAAAAARVLFERARIEAQPPPPPPPPPEQQQQPPPEQPPEGGGGGGGGGGGEPPPPPPCTFPPTTPDCIPVP